MQLGIAGEWGGQLMKLALRSYERWKGATGPVRIHRGPHPGGRLWRRENTGVLRVRTIFLATALAILPRQLYACVKVRS